MPLRTYLLLSRPWYFPTVWSNCVAGWWLGGAGHHERLPFLLAGVTALFLSGSFLKDALDAPFDAQNRRWRPLPSRSISFRGVCAWALVFALVGVGLLFAVGRAPGLIGAGLLLCVLAYNSSHRWFMLSPALLGMCRCLVYLVSATVAERGITGWVLWGGIAVGAYTAGSRWLIPEGSAQAPRRYWCLLFLLFPVLLGLLMNAGEYQETGWLLALVVVLWVIRSLRHTWFSLEPDPSSTYSGLVAGTVFVDWLAAADLPKMLSAAFVGLFLVALLLQRGKPGISGRAR